MLREGLAQKEPEKAEPSQLEGEEASLYASLSARLNYLALDRTDVAFSVKQLMRKLSKPNVEDMERLKRVGRYLFGKPRLFQEFQWQDRPEGLDVYTDSDFAGCRLIRKSTSGGCLMWGTHC